MKNIFILLLSVLFIAPVTASAQKTTATRITRNKTYRTITTVKQPRKRIVWYQGEADLGLGLGDFGNGFTAGPTFETVHGIHITKYFFTGIGVGVHYLDDVFVPIFLDLKGFYPINDNVAPFLNIDLGYDPLENHGMYGEFGVGVKYKRWKFSAGVQLHEYYTEYDHRGSYPGEYFECVASGFLKVGITF